MKNKKIIVCTFIPHTNKKDSVNMSMNDIQKNISSVKDTPFGYTLSMISGKWKMVIMYWIIEYQPIRYNELHRKIGTISFRTLSQQLRELEEDGIIIRKEYPQIPPKVEYSLSEKGLSLMPILEEMCKWGEEHS